MANYRKKGVTPMEPWTREVGPTYVELQEAGISISQEDINNGSPQDGDMIAWSPANPSDRWLVNAEYFAENYELAGGS